MPARSRAFLAALQLRTELQEVKHLHAPGRHAAREQRALRGKHGCERLAGRRISTPAHLRIKLHAR